MVGKCLDCEKTITTSQGIKLKDHICGHGKCSNCGDYCDLIVHKCYMTAKECKGGVCTGECSDKKKCYSCKTYTEKYIFYDFECMQETGVHIVNLAICQDFEGTKHMFTSLEDFCNYAISEKHKRYTFIAHNSKGYDCQFILKWCIENGLKPYCIYAGTKIMSMDIQDLQIRFIDSLNFVASALATFPKTFDLKETKKGYFPHYFNTLSNQNYVGPMPCKTRYGYNQMVSANRKAFLVWYDERIAENYIFDFKKELREYCDSDVDILRRSMLKFRKDFIELENIDPLQYVTIASVCMAIYRSKYMPAKTIGVVKDVTRGECYSKISIAWIDWIAQRYNVKIQHALNGGEVTLKGIGKVDGFCEQTNTVYEFQGCFWHGCSSCYSDDSINTKNQMDMLTLRKRTLEKNGLIREAGYKLVEMYECDLKNDKTFKEFMKTYDREIVSKLDPRDAFFGGRTNITKLTYDFKEGESGGYIDFCSLYPTVQFYKRYPTGHPTKILEPESYDEHWLGYVKCKVLPPKNLYHPVLPVKTMCGASKKLLFALCKACTEVKQPKCTHSDQERSFIGTWCTNEMEVALSKGYQIQKIYEVWHFEKSSEDLFKGYVRKFMKIKMESSPLITGPDCRYKSDDHFRLVVKERLDIDLGVIVHNPGKRAIAKLCLNSLWGKYGQRNNMKQTLYVTELVEFYKILLDDKINDLNIQFINDDMVQMTYNLKDQFVDNSNSTNIFVASFTTSHARMMLYEVLDKLDDQVLGFDTDSAWYIQRPGGATIETGDMLGELTDELDGDHIVQWVASGPKSYSYLTSKGKAVCKVKGFTLNHENSQVINMDGMRALINKQKERITIVNEQQITRDPKTKLVVNRYQEKDFRYVYDKRSVHNDGHGNIDTLPWGYEST